MKKTNIQLYQRKIYDFLNLVPQTPNLETARKMIGIHSTVITHLKEIKVLTSNTGLRKQYTVTRQPNTDEIMAAIKAKQSHQKKYYSKYMRQSGRYNERIMLEDKFVMDAY